MNYLSINLFFLQLYFVIFIKTSSFLLQSSMKKRIWIFFKSWTWTRHRRHQSVNKSGTIAKLINTWKMSPPAPQSSTIIINVLSSSFLQDLIMYLIISFVAKRKHQFLLTIHNVFVLGHTCKEIIKSQLNASKQCGELLMNKSFFLQLYFVIFVKTSSSFLLQSSMKKQIRIFSSLERHHRQQSVNKSGIAK